MLFQKFKTNNFYLSSKKMEVVLLGRGLCSFFDIIHVDSQDAMVRQED